MKFACPHCQKHLEIGYETLVSYFQKDVMKCPRCTNSISVEEIKHNIIQNENIERNN
jgi:hypothetical protein